MFRIILKKLREEKELAQHQLADLLGKSQSTVGMWESGKSYPDYATLIKLAEFFGVSVSYLIGETTQKGKTPSEEGVRKGTIQIAGRDGSFVERELTDDQIDIVKRMIDQMPDFKG